jgi:eukaryotic-like serine/threonine-protein kinase
MAEKFALSGYVTDELIGFGGTGEVWRAREIANGEIVALKRLRRRGPAATQRLRREAALLAIVAGPHVVRLRQLIVEGDETVLVMDYAAGGSLASVLAARPRLPAPEVVTIVAPIAAALADAHARDLVHGDVSPANILFTSDGRPLLADFGVAHALGSAPDAVQGTDDYLDPAVTAGSPLSSSSDVFALGAVAFHALTGQPVWGSGTSDQIQGRALIGVRESLDELAPDVPAALVSVIESALRLDPHERPDARSMSSAVLRACAAAPVQLPGLPLTVSVPLTHQVRPPPTVNEPLVVADVASSAPVRPLRWLYRLTPSRLRLVAAASAVVMISASVYLGVMLGDHSGDQGYVLDTGPLNTAAAATLHASKPMPKAFWVARVTHLDNLRAATFARADSLLLLSVYDVTSPAYSTDLATVSSLASRGLRARGFTATVESVTPESLTAGTEKVRVVDRLSGYSLVDASGHEVGRGAPRPARAFTMSLTEYDGTWLISAIALA